MARRFALAVLMLLSAGSFCGGETVRLKATADVWLSDANAQERDTSAGKAPQFKLKTIQEMAAIRFDASPAKGRQVLRAALFLHRAGPDQLRYVRVSTVNGDWEEGNGQSAYGPGDGATYTFADFGSKRPWSWPGSCFADVVMSSGNTLATWAERKELENGWISVALTPELVYALVAGDSDGLAVMDGGTPAYFNNFIHSVQSGANAPYIEVELGGAAAGAPAAPVVRAVPAPERAHIATGALQVTIAEAKGVCCWKLTLNGTPVERWRVKHPASAGPTAFVLDELPPGQRCSLEVTAVAPGGAVSAPTRVTANASPALDRSLALKPFESIRPGKEPPIHDGKLRAWALPGLVKLSPEKAEPMYGDLGEPDYRAGNAVWDGSRIRLFGARGEYVSYQLCIENAGAAPLAGVRVIPQPLSEPGGASISGPDIELFRNWYARPKNGKWQPAYCIPIGHGDPFQVPDPARNLPAQENQTLTVDVYIPKDARPAQYTGAVRIEAEGVTPFTLPVELAVFDFALPDRLSFWPELNAYRVAPTAYYQLAHQHRTVLNCWTHRPGVTGAGKDLKINWDGYDREVGPLLTGEAFRNNRRAGDPVEVLYLPFEDSWPTPLTKETYNYQGYWPGRGDDRKWINEHYLKAPYIGDALSQGYKDAFLAAQQQFIEHFKEKGYNRTELQCFYGGKNTHRIDYGSNMWWTTDEPYHWDDWLALQFFDALWTKGRGDAPKSIWSARADISRPQWQGKVLDGIVNEVYFGAGASASPDNWRRCRTLAQETGLDLRVYGSANPDTASNTGSVGWCINAWANGARAVLPWQTLGDDGALDNNDGAGGGGNALLVPGRRFGQPVVADMRLKALREGQQIVEYLVLLAQRKGLQREQVRDLLARAMNIQVGARAGAGADNADALQFGTLQTWQISELRRRLAELIGAGPAFPTTERDRAVAPRGDGGTGQRENGAGGAIDPLTPLTSPGVERGTAKAVMVPQGPALDGTLADPLWRKSPAFVLGEATGAGTVTPGTTARVLFDPTTLYVGFECQEPDTASLKKDVTRRDGSVWEDDCVEVFVSADPELGYRHFGVNAIGTVMDEARRPNADPDFGWNSGIRAKTAVEKGKGWSVTLAIPLKDLDAYVGENETWRLNLTRSRPARGNDAAQDSSWAILPTTDFHQPAAFGVLSGVSIPARADGVTRRRSKPADAGEQLKPDMGTQSGDVTLFYRPDLAAGPGGFEPVGKSVLDVVAGGGTGKALRIRRTTAGGDFGAALPTRVAGSTGLKIAYLCKAKGVPRAGINLFDQVSGDNTTARDYRLLSDAQWQPVLYFADTFRYNGGPNTPENNVRAQTFFQNIRFHGEEQGSKDTWMQVCNFVVYRGNDRTPPSQVQGLKAEAGQVGARLTWLPAADNTAVMLYVVSRAAGTKGPFQKVAETCETSYLDLPPSPGPYRYRVLACDFEENLGEWSETVTVNVKGAPGAPPPPPVEVNERYGYADHVREIAKAGEGKVDRTRVTCYGDSLTAATMYPQEAEAALGTKRVAGYGYPGMQTSWGKEHAAENLERDKPYVALILFGTNNPKDPASIQRAMADIEAMANIAIERGIIPVFGTIPPRGFTDPDSRPEAAYNQALIETCRRLRVPCGHLFEEYQRLPDRRALIAGDGVHNTAAGMAASAQGWRKAVAQVNWVLRDRP